MSFPKDLEADAARLKLILEKALIEASKKELNELLWKLVLENVSQEDAKEIGKIVDKFFTYGVEFNIRPNFQIIGFMPASLTKDQKNN